MDAILKAPELKIKFPGSELEIQQSADAFKSISRSGVIDGCIGALDGILIPCIAPAATQVGKVSGYFSGHYHRMGINVQACVDANCRFIFLSVAAPGGTNDIAAIWKTGFLNEVEKLPIGKYIAADCAYIVTEHILTPFPNMTRMKSVKKDAFNYYLSQLCQVVERAFGIMGKRWRILNSPLEVKMSHVGKLILCIGMLHNFCAEDVNYITRAYDDVNTDIIQFNPSDITVTSIPGVSMMRDFLVEKIAREGLVRPSVTTI